MKLLDEVNSIQLKITDITQLLKEEYKSHEKLCTEVEEKKKLIESMNESKTRTYLDHQRSKKEFADRKIALDRKMRDKIKGIEGSEAALRNEVSAIDVISQENVKLHEKLKAVTLEYLAQRVRNESEREQRKQKNFDFGITMDQMMRRQVKDLYSNYKDNALVNMDAEASDAWLENKALLSELQKRLSASLQLLEDQQRSYEKLKKVKIREEVELQGVKIQENLAKSLSSVTDRQHRILEKVSEMEESLRTSFEESRSRYERKLFLLETLSHKEGLLRAAREEHAAKKEHSVKFVEHLVDAAMGFVDRDRIKSVNYLLGDTNADIDKFLPDEDSASSVHAAQAAAEPHVVSPGADPDALWNNAYKQQHKIKGSRMNVSFSMARPLV